MNLFRTGLGLALAAAAAVALAQARFEVSSRPVEMTWPTNDWNGRHAFRDVFCINYPNPRNARGLTQVMFNRDTLYLARLVYDNDIAIYIATSVIPANRTESEELARMLETNRQGAHSAPTEITAMELAGGFGPMAGLVMRNAVEGNASAPFPFFRRMMKPDDGSLRSLSVHRLFPRGPDRIEVAGLQYFPTTPPKEKEQDAMLELTKVVDSVVNALQQCTAGMPVRSR